jgi:integrase
LGKSIFACGRYRLVVVDSAGFAVVFEDVIDAYLSARCLLCGEAERDRYSLMRLSPYFSGRRIADLKRGDVRSYMAMRQADGVKLATVQRELCLLSSAINFCNLEFDLSCSNPVARLGLGHSERRVRWITKQEAARLLCEAERARRPHLPVFIRLALNTGCRRGELLGLEWNRVDIQHKKILLEARHTKTRRRRTVPLNDDALGVLERLKAWQWARGLASPWVFGYADGRRIMGFKTAWMSALRRAGIENFRIHDLRHTFASWLVMQGVSIYVVRDLLGHASVTQTEIYAHLAPDQGVEAVRRFLIF